METALNSFQSAIVEHPDVTFMGTTLRKSIKTNEDVEYNLFEIKSTGLNFGLDKTAFSGLVPGKEIKSIHPELEGRIDTSADWIWLWPWDIVRILVALSPYAGAIFSQPQCIMNFVQNVNEQEVTPDFARQTSADTATWSRFYRDLGNSETFGEFWPKGAKMCRIIGGSGETMPPADTIGDPPEPTEKILQFIAELAKGIGILFGETVGAAVAIFGIVACAVTVCVATEGIGCPIAITAGIILIVLLIIGWVIAVAADILNMIIQGILILG